MNITEVRVKLMHNRSDRLRAFCSITIDDDFVVHDTESGTYEDVPVFIGRLWSKYYAREYGRYPNPADESQLRWYDDVRLSITDSNPQYFSIGVNTSRPDGPPDQR